MCPPGISLCSVAVVRVAFPVYFLRVVEAAQVEEEPVDHNDDECPEGEHAEEHERHGEY